MMLTAKDGEWDQAEALDTGADDYLTKPFSFAVLLARLRALIRRAARERPAVLEAGDLASTRPRGSVTAAPSRSTSTPREFAMLEFLMRRAGEVVSKREILDNVWDDDFEGDPNIVEVYVSHLRNKVDRPFGREAIVTRARGGLPVWGRGVAERAPRVPVPGPGPSAAPRRVAPDGRRCGPASPRPP